MIHWTLNGVLAEYAEVKVELKQQQHRAELRDKAARLERELNDMELNRAITRYQNAIRGVRKPQECQVRTALVGGKAVKVHRRLISTGQSELCIK